MLYSPRRILGAFGFAASIAASARVPGILGPRDLAPPVVREFTWDEDGFDAGSTPEVRSFLLDAADLAPADETAWRPDPAVLGDAVLFENRLDASAQVDLSRTHRPPELPAPQEVATETADPPGHFFLERYVPLAGDTFRQAALRLGCIPELLAIMNGRPGKPEAKLDPKRSIEIYRGPVTAHTIRAGDTLWSISRRYRVPLRELLWLNRLPSLDIRPGQVVYVTQGVVSKDLERRAATDLKTSTLLAKAKQKFRDGKEASAASSKGIRVSRPVPGSISSGFGWRRHPILKRVIFHNAIDIVAAKGTPIRALYGGKVIFAGRSGPGGKSIVIRHPNNLETIYAHCAEIHVKKGETVAQGRRIGRVGDTGRATSPHLHFAMRRGRSALDPLPYLR